MTAEETDYRIDGYLVEDGTVLWSYRANDWVTITIDKTNSQLPLTCLPIGGRWASDGHLTKGEGSRDLFWDKLEIKPPAKPKRRIVEPVELFVNSYSWGMGGIAYNSKEKALNDGKQEGEKFLEVVTVKGERNLFV